MLFDSHSHTEFSSDSQMTAEEAIAAAEKQGIGLVFTEHYDVDILDNFNYNGTMDFRFDPHAYWEKYEALRSEKLSLGVELGLVDGNEPANLDFISQVPFDMVIGSVHNIDRYDLYYPDFYKDKDKAAAYNRYFSDMANLVTANSYIDVLGHIDYICRYAPYDNKEIQYGEFSESIDKVLKAVLENDVIMELNTRRLGDRLAMKELVPVYSRYAELGGKYITIGSDAHKAEAIGMNFEVAQDFAEALNLEIVTFRNRVLEVVSR